MSFYDEVIQADPRFHTLDCVRDMNLLEPVTRAAVEAIMADAAARGITLEVTETYRSQERQRHLYASGATQLQTAGVHHYGLAADFCKIIDGKPSWAGDWQFLCQLAEAHGLISGGDWGQPTVAHTFRDFDHVQRVSVADQNPLFADNWYPDASYTATTASLDR